MSALAVFLVWFVWVDLAKLIVPASGLRTTLIVSDIVALALIVILALGLVDRYGAGI